jgi:hypothetical protein
MILLVAFVMIGAGVAVVVTRSSGGSGPTSGVGLDHSPPSCAPDTCVQNLLSSVSCASASFCVAVGGHSVATSTGYSDEQTLIEMWNGSSWSIAAPPDLDGARRSLTGVSCPTTTFCVAVGGRVVPAGSSGTYDQIIETWYDHAWHMVQRDTTESTELSGVACQSNSSCVAVGKAFPKDSGLRPLIETWDGTRWATTPSPHENEDDFLNAVSCGEQSSCFAVGTNFSIGTGNYGEATSAERSRGSSWTLTPSVNPSAKGNDLLNGVNCAFLSSCFAVGNFNTDAFSGNGNRALIEQWNGRSWSRSATPKVRESDVRLSGVTCANVRLCFAVGSRGSQSAHSLIVEWNGSSWARIASPSDDYFGTGTVTLNGVSCVSASRCIAVGNYPDRQGTFQSLIEEWNGRTWSELVAPNVDG